MRSRDVIELYNMIKVGARVQIIDTTQNEAIAANIVHPPPASVPPNIVVPAAVTAAVAANGAKPAVSGPPPTAATPAVLAKKQWAGAPTNLLAKQNAVDKAKARPPVGAPSTARPVSNNSPADGSTPSSANPLSRPVLDSL